MLFFARMLLVLGLTAFGFAPAGAAELEDFFGYYEGESVNIIPGETQPRQLAVRISPDNKGFVINWQAHIARSDGSMKEREFEVVFRPSKKPGVFASAMAKNLFGNLVPYDPLSGEPFYWASLTDDTLSIFVLQVLEKSTYELLRYDRTLTPRGMNVRFTYLWNGQKLREVYSVLERIE